jgi:hypothetical protein
MSTRISAVLAGLVVGVGGFAVVDAVSSGGSHPERSATAAAAITQPAASAPVTGSRSTGTSKNAAAATPKSGAAAGSRQPAAGGAQHGGTASSGANPVSEHNVDIVEAVHITSRQGSLVMQQGDVTGSPIGHGTIVMRDVLNGTGAAVDFTIHTRGGSVVGNANATLQVKGSTVLYGGIAHLTHGTGLFSRVRAPHLTVTGSGDLRGTATFKVSGTEWY